MNVLIDLIKTKLPLNENQHLAIFNKTSENYWLRYDEKIVFEDEYFIITRMNGNYREEVFILNDDVRGFQFETIIGNDENKINKMSKTEFLKELETW